MALLHHVNSLKRRLILFFFSDVGDGIINNNRVIWKGTDIRDLDRSTSYIRSIYHGTGYVGICFDQRTIPRV